jgi:hypothetical protein
MAHAKVQRERRRRLAREAAEGQAKGAAGWLGWLRGAGNGAGSFEEDVRAAKADEVGAAISWGLLSCGMLLLVVQHVPAVRLASKLVCSSFHVHPPSREALRLSTIHVLSSLFPLSCAMVPFIRSMRCLG